MKQQLPHRCILDLRGLVTHAFYRGQPSHTVIGKDGKRVPSAVHAVDQFIATYLSPILREFNPIDIIGVLEGGNANARRRAVFNTYKAKDEQDADDPVVVEQKKIALEEVQKLLLGLGAMLVKTPFAEADDTIAYLTTRLHGTKAVYTVDNDLLQLHAADTVIMVTDWTTGQPTAKSVFKGMNLEDEDGEPAKPIEMVRLYKSIVGDASDQYPGVKGIGEAKFAELVQRYGWDGMLELDNAVLTGDFSALEGSIEVDPDPVLKKMLERKDEWRTSHFLARLHPEWCEQSYGEKLVRPQWAKRVPAKERILKVLEPLGLEHHYQSFERFMPKQWLIDSKVLEKLLAGSATNYKRMIADMQASPVVAFDWESYDQIKHEPYQRARKGGYVDTLNQVLTGASFCFGQNLQYSFYLAVNHRDTANCQPEIVKKLLQELQFTPMVAHNAKFEMTVAKTNWDYDFPNSNLPEDTMIQMSYVDENGDGGLKKISKAWLNYDQINYTDVVPDGGDMRDVSGQEVLQYGADDSVVCAHLRTLFKTIMECEQTWNFYKENEPFFDKALLVPFLKGIPFDYARLAELEREDDALFEKTDSELRALLIEHCSDINESGFKVLWPEICEYQTAVMKTKDKTDAEIAQKLEDLRMELHEKCRYEPYVPPYITLDKQTISNAARSLSLPAVRSLRSNKLFDWCDGINHQLQEMNEGREEEIKLDEQQEQFVCALMECADCVEHARLINAEKEFPQLKKLREVVTGIYADNRELWEGDELNVGSSLQMAQLFYGKMGLPVKVRNIVKEDESVRSQFDLEGAPSTNEIAIKTWMLNLEPSDWRYQALDRVLTLRAVRTRRQLYYKPYPLWESPIDGNIHPGIRNCGTITRRPSGSSPNILQVSDAKDEGHMRSCFLPQMIAQILRPDGNWEVSREPQVIISFDFVQQELAILAGLSGDKNLLSCYVGNNKKDVHSMTGCAILNMGLRKRGKPLMAYEEYRVIRKNPDHELHKAVEKARKYAKVTNFLIVYGGSASGLARKVIVPVEMAQEFIEGFDATYPDVRKFQEKMVKFAKRHGFVKSSYGTRKHCDGIFSKKGGEASSWERQAINFPIQGGAADALKVVLREIVTSRLVEETGATLYAPVYDEIVASVPVSMAVEYVRRMKQVMEQRIPNSVVQLATSISIGPNWGDLTEFSDPTPEEINECIAKCIDEVRQKRQLLEAA